MPIISATPVRRARKSHRCETCGRFAIPPGTPYIRLYGYAHRGDTPSVLHICLDCADDAEDKCRDALRELNRTLAEEMDGRREEARRG